MQSLLGELIILFQEIWTKKKKKRREGPCIVDRVPFSEKSFSFDEKLSMEHPLLYKLVIKKKKKKEQFVMCTYTHDKESNFHFCQRLISVVVSRGYDVRDIPWVSSEKKFHCVAQNGENLDK